MAGNVKVMLAAEDVAMALARAGEDATSERVNLISAALDAGAVSVGEGLDTDVAVARARHYVDEVLPNLVPQQIPQAVFRQLVQAVPAALPARGYEFRFRGEHVGWGLDASEGELNDVHRRIVNNALYWNWESEQNPYGITQPSGVALNAYPSLREKYPRGARIADWLYEDRRIHADINDTALGIFADGYRDRDGLPVRDTFAYSLRAEIHGAAARDWPKERLARWVGSFSTAEMVMMQLGRHEQVSRGRLAATQHDGKTPGQRAYERDVERHPTHQDGSKRPEWGQLKDYQRFTWERDPTDRMLGRGAGGNSPVETSELEVFLRDTQADQGGEATFADWVRATAADAGEVAHSQAVEYLRLGGDLRDKSLGADGRWLSSEARSLEIPQADAAALLDINGRLFAPVGSTVDGLTGSYEQARNGVLLRDLQGEPFVFVVSNKHNEYFFVSCRQTDEGIRYLHSTSTPDERRLGLDALGYKATGELAEKLVRAVRAFASTRAKLRHFDVQFEDVGYTNSDLSDRVLSESEASGFTATAIKERSLPDRVVAVVRGYITEDDHQTGNDRKVFACITLRVAAESENAAEDLEPPKALLTQLADMMATDVGGNLDLALEGNWEVSTGSAEMIAATPEGRSLHSGKVEPGHRSGAAHVESPSPGM
ncbi:hypothetical protein [Burkholderia vietnamiensis]|uniref:hypothetical protein n=1 Tax=Burkholderia vietnamiensis TaxID=60552 RepID=UPI001593D999|nr:hypothetical protein [Burkholderia vietnamiensis]